MAVLVVVALILVLPLAGPGLLDRDLRVVIVVVTLPAVVVAQEPLGQTLLLLQAPMVVLESLLRLLVNQSFTQGEVEAVAGKRPVLPLVVEAAEEMVA
jgi:hypothetical protein